MPKINLNTSENQNEEVEIEVLFIAPELKNIVAQTEDLFSWENEITEETSVAQWDPWGNYDFSQGNSMGLVTAAYSGAKKAKKKNKIEVYERLNYLTINECLNKGDLLKRIKKYQDKDFGIVFLFDQLEGPLLNNLLALGEDEIKPVQILDMESSEDELWSLLYHPAREICDLLFYGTEEEFENLKGIEVAGEGFRKSLKIWKDWAEREWDFRPEAIRDRILNKAEDSEKKEKIALREETPTFVKKVENKNEIDIPPAHLIAQSLTIQVPAAGLFCANGKNKEEHQKEFEINGKKLKIVETMNSENRTLAIQVDTMEPDLTKQIDTLCVTMHPEEGKAKTKELPIRWKNVSLLLPDLRRFETVLSINDLEEECGFIIKNISLAPRP